MRTGAAFVVVFASIVAGGCGTGETDRPPPIGATRGSDPGVVGGDVGGADGDGGMGVTTTGAAGTGDTDGTFGTFGTAGDVEVLSGSILTDASFFPLPMDCTINLHEPGAVDPGTGLSSGSLIDVPVVLDAPQQNYDIGLDEVRSVVNQGDLVYVEVRCDLDGDGSFDPIGGWYPLLPAEIVELPADDIDLVVGDLPV